MLTQRSDPSIHIGIPLYPAFDSLDVLGPYQVFTLTGQAKVYLIGPDSGAITDTLKCAILSSFELDDPCVAAQEGYVQSFEGVRIKYDYTYGGNNRSDDSTFPDLDILFVPGGPQPQLPLYMGKRGSNPYLRLLQDFAQKMEKESERSEKMLLSSVCVGSLLLAAAGLLDGYQATTHWAFRSVLESFPHVNVAAGYPRYVIDGNRITGGGISSGIDQALAMVSILMGNDVAKRVQLGMQYSPNPPFNSGDPSVAKPAILHNASQGTRPLVEAAQLVFNDFVNG